MISAQAREWLTLQEKKLAPATFAKAVWTFETLVFPYVGSRPIAINLVEETKRGDSAGTDRADAHRGPEFARHIPSAEHRFRRVPDRRFPIFRIDSLP